MEQKSGRLPIFTERFKELQGERSNTEFANFLGISRQTVGFYYNGDRAPDALTLIKISEKCKVSVDWLLGMTQSKKRESVAVDELNLTDDAVDAITYMDDSVRRVLCILAEQEICAGKSEEIYASYLHSGYYDSPFNQVHLLQRISDYFCVCGDNAPEFAEYNITDRGDILSDIEVENLWFENRLDCERLIPIETTKLIEEAFMSDIRSMLISLKKRYYMGNK